MKFEHTKYYHCKAVRRKAWSTCAFVKLKPNGTLFFSDEYLQMVDDINESSTIPETNIAPENLFYRSIHTYDDWINVDEEETKHTCEFCRWCSGTKKCVIFDRLNDALINSELFALDKRIFGCIFWEKIGKTPDGSVFDKLRSKKGQTNEHGSTVQSETGSE
jgi:hypothetical protein